MMSNEEDVLLLLKHVMGDKTEEAISSQLQALACCGVR